MATMTDAEYEVAVSQLLLFAGLARNVDAAGVLERISRAETLGSIFDPTLYRKAMPKLELICSIARGMVAFQNTLPSREECEAAEAHQAACERMEGRL